MSGLLASEVSISGLMDTRGEWRQRPRRRWPEDLKRQIVSDTFVAGASVSVVARRHDVNANQVFRWRQRYGAALGGFVAVSVVQDSVPPEIPVDPVRTDATVRRDYVEIDIGGSHRVRVGPGFDRDTLERVLDVLSSR
jgi:transposase